MQVILIILGSIGLMVGSIATGILSCWLLWSAFKRVGHPEWGPPIVLIPAILALSGRLPTNEFFALSLIFAGLAVIPFWAEGLAWRARMRAQNRDEPQHQDKAPAVEALPSASPSYRRYPAIVGCICEARRPAPAELKKVASRMLRETFGARSPIPVAEKRAALRAAAAALEGN